MKEKLIFALSLLSLVACANAPVKPEPVKIAAPPIKVTDVPKTLASIDPNTLKVTYEKGTDPKFVVDQVVKAWAEATTNLNACQTKLKDLEKK